MNENDVRTKVCGFRFYCSKKTECTHSYRFYALSAAPKLRKSASFQFQNFVVQHNTHHIIATTRLGGPCSNDNLNQNIPYHSPVPLMMTTMMNAIVPSASSSSLRRRRRRRLIMNNMSYLFVFLSLVTMMIMTTTAATTTTAVMAEEEQREEKEKDYVNESRIRRLNSKPWLMREFQLLDIPTNVHEKINEIIESQFGHHYDHGGNVSQKIIIIPKQLFISPFTIICVAILLINIWSFVSYHLSGSWVEGSHILVKDTSEKTHKGLISLRDQLGSNYQLFGSSAKEYSQCPSSEQRGDLGRFVPGSMAPSFDHICFDSTTPVGQTIGPIQTKHGYHLIYIRKRKF